MATLNELLNDIAPNPPITDDPTGGTTGSYQWGIPREGAADPQIFVYNAVIILIWALGIAAVITFIIAGVRYLTAGGEAEKAESAKKIIIGSLIGMLIIMGSYLIFNTAITALKSNSKLDQPGQVEGIFRTTYPTSP